MVNRITHLFGPANSTSNSGANEVLESVNRVVRLRLEVLEQDVCQRPKLWLGIAFTLGVGLAWLIKRK